MRSPTQGRRPPQAPADLSATRTLTDPPEADPSNDVPITEIEQAVVAAIHDRVNVLVTTLRCRYRLKSVERAWDPAPPGDSAASGSLGA